MKRFITLIICLTMTIAGCWAQDSLRFENMACINTANSDVQNGLTYSMTIDNSEDRAQIVITLENFPNLESPFTVKFGKPISMGAGKVIWMDNGSFVLSRIYKGTGWMFFFGSTKTDHALVPCQLIRLTDSGNTKMNEAHQLIFTKEQAQQVEAFLKAAEKKGIISKEG